MSTNSKYENRVRILRGKKLKYNDINISFAGKKLKYYEKKVTISWGTSWNVTRKMILWKSRDFIRKIEIWKILWKNYQNIMKIKLWFYEKKVVILCERSCDFMQEKNWDIRKSWNFVRKILILLEKSDFIRKMLWFYEKKLKFYERRMWFMREK